MLQANYGDRMVMVSCTKDHSLIENCNRVFDPKTGKVDNYVAIMLASIRTISDACNLPTTHYMLAACLEENTSRVEQLPSRMMRPDQKSAVCIIE
jgi:hypothetical protein